MPWERSTSWRSTAALNPTLLAAVTFMLSRRGAGWLMLGYFMGAMFTSLACGLLIVFALDGSSSATSTASAPSTRCSTSSSARSSCWSRTPSRAGALSRSWRAGRRRRRRSREGPAALAARARPRVGAHRAGRLAGAHAAGRLLPRRARRHRQGEPFLALRPPRPSFVQRDHAGAAEIRLLGFAFAPEKTNALVLRFGDWLRRRGGRIALIVALVVGVGLITRGVISAST